MNEITLNDELRREYAGLFASCRVRDAHRREVEDTITRVMKAKPRYAIVGLELGIPWWFIAAAHQREASGSFLTHLHNGDSLKARTVNVPAGRPVEGTPPFTWEQSARDAMRLKRYDQWKDWTVAGVLWLLERYNGLGYRKRGVPSPYLWSFSQHYEHGKYVADGRFDSTFVDKQCGAAVLLRRMVDQALIDIEGTRT